MSPGCKYRPCVSSQGASSISAFAWSASFSASRRFSLVTQFSSSPLSLAAASSATDAGVTGDRSSTSPTAGFSL